MMDQEARFCPARPEDASVLAELVNCEGLPLYWWGKLTAPRETAWEVGRKRAARNDGSLLGHR